MRKETKRLKDLNNALWLLTIVFAVACLVLIITNVIGEKKLYDNNFVIPKTHSGVYYDLDDPFSIVIFNLEDPVQIEIAREVDLFFKQYSQQVQGR